MLQGLTDGQSTLILGMAWCRQAVTLANIDPCLYCHKASLGHNVTLDCFLMLYFLINNISKNELVYSPSLSIICPNSWNHVQFQYMLQIIVLFYKSMQIFSLDVSR